VVTERVDFQEYGCRSSNGENEFDFQNLFFGSALNPRFRLSTEKPQKSSTTERKKPLTSACWTARSKLR